MSYWENLLLFLRALGDDCAYFIPFLALLAAAEPGSPVSSTGESLFLHSRLLVSGVAFGLCALHAGRKPLLSAAGDSADGDCSRRVSCRIPLSGQMPLSGIDCRRPVFVLCRAGDWEGVESSRIQKIHC